MTPDGWSAPVFRAASFPIAAFLALWHLCSYTATAVGSHKVSTTSSHSPGISEPDQLHMDLSSALSLSVQKVSQKNFVLLSWLTVSQALPAIFRSIGVYVFDSPPPLMLPLGALLLLTVVIAGLARSSLSMSIQERRVLARHSNALKTLAVASEACAVFGCLSRFQSALDLLEVLLRSQLCTSHEEAPYQRKTFMLCI